LRHLPSECVKVFPLPPQCPLEMGPFLPWKIHTYTTIGYWPASMPLNKQGVCHTMGLPSTLKSILRQKKNYENANISKCKSIIFIKTNPIKETKIH